MTSKKYYNTKVHFIYEKNRAACGHIITPVLLASKDKTEVTCSVCFDKIKWDKGKLDEWKIGGNYNKKGDERENIN